MSLREQQPIHFSWSAYNSHRALKNDKSVSKTISTKPPSVGQATATHILRINMQLMDLKSLFFVACALHLIPGADSQGVGGFNSNFGMTDQPPDVPPPHMMMMMMEPPPPSPPTSTGVTPTNMGGGISAFRLAGGLSLGSGLLGLFRGGGGQIPNFVPLTAPRPLVPLTPFVGPSSFGPSRFGPPGFGPRSFGPPGFGPPGFGPPSFGPPGFGPPGFGAPGFGPPGFGPSPMFGGFNNFQFPI